MGDYRATPDEIRQAVEDIKSEVRQDILAGTVSASVSSFSELHDYVDANTYGGLSDEGPESRGSWGTASVVLVQDKVDAWLKQDGGSSSEVQQDYIKAAREQYQREGELEVSDNAEISESEDGGAYVQAWVWVADIGTKEND